MRDPKQGLQNRTLTMLVDQLDHTGVWAKVPFSMQVAGCIRKGSGAKMSKSIKLALNETSSGFDLHPNKHTKKFYINSIVLY